MKFDKFLEFVVEYVFSFGALTTFIGVLFFYIMFLVFEQENAAKEEAQTMTAVCYSQGMVLVDTDAGPRCVYPQYLVKVK